MNEDTEEEEDYEDHDWYWCDLCQMWSDMSVPYGTCMCS